MALTSTLFTGMSGLDVNQTKLNVVGNNIANANTVAFKSSRALFKPQFYVTDTPGAPSTGDFGGENPSQHGLGAVVSSIEKDYSPGQVEPTGKATDLAIEGDGFFVVQGKEQKYTRDGSFTLNQNNQLVTTSGDFVQGFGVDTNGNIVAGAVQNIQIPLGSLAKAQATEHASFQGNLNASGAIALGASVLDSGVALTDVGSGSAAAPTSTSKLIDLRDDANPMGTAFFADGDTLTLAGKRGGRQLSALTFTIDAGTSLGDLQNFFNQGLAIDTSVTPPTGAPTPGATLTSSTPTGSLFSVIGNVGEDNALSLAGTSFTSTNSAMTLSFSDAANSDPSGESVYTTFAAYDSLGTPLTVNITAVLESRDDAGTTWRFFATSADDTDAKAFDPAAASHPGSILGTGTISFDNDGKLVSSANAQAQISRNDTGADTPLTIALNFDRMTALTSTQSQMLPSEQDGHPIGTLTSFSIGGNGVIVGSFDNGLQSTLGQIALATFDNNQGLVDKGGSMLVAGANSGNAKISAPLTLTAGQIRAGALEQSNVDLSNEFVNMIIASTGFSAASRVITTSDQLITELLNSTR
jgi:flagellar hook protein FlgE